MNPMSNPLRLAGEPIAPPPGPAVLAMGFRPFFFAAALFGAVVIPLWIVMFTGHVPPGGGLPATWWHAHEMLYGYTAAVLVGFLLTAVRNWTGGHMTAANGALGALVGLWVLGRVAHAPGVPGGWWSALPDMAFLLSTTFAIGRPLIKKGSRRNYGFLVALPVMAAASLGLHIAASGGGASLLRPSLDVPVAVMVGVMTIVAGRIVPMFTRNGLGVEFTRVAPIEAVLPYALAAVVAVAVLTLPAPVEAAVLVLAGALVLGRMAGWRSLQTFGAPLLWVLHIGHAWIGVGLALQGAAALGWVSPSAGLHAITAGAIGSLTVGMMARVSLGHTGRLLATSPMITASLAFVVLAGALRVTAAFLPDIGPLLHSAGAAWSLSLLLWLLVYTPIVWRPRADGKPG